MTSIPLTTTRGRPLWLAAQLMGVALTLALLVALWMAPVPSLALLWDMVIPLLPAVFLLNPLIWRNVCPLATLTDLGGRLPGRRAISPQLLRYSWVIGVVLLFVLVPARRFLFNTNGPALAITVTLVALLALASGMYFSRRAGFCNTICPVLPVEKLYGQAPIVPMHGVRCSTCSLCTPVGCIDLAGSKTVAQTIGPLRRDTSWLRTGFGAFAAAFPGFIVAYFTTSNGEWAVALPVYLRVLGFALVSFALVASATTLLRIKAAVAMPLLGAVSLGLYYWYAAPNLTKAYAAPEAATLVIRVTMGVTLVWWLWHTLTRMNGRRASMTM